MKIFSLFRVQSKVMWQEPANQLHLLWTNIEKLFIEKFFQGSFSVCTPYILSWYLLFIALSVVIISFIDLISCLYPTKNSQCLFDSWQTKTNTQLKSWNQGRPAINTSHRESQSPPTSSARSPPAWHYNCFASLIVNFQKSPSIYRQCSGLKEVVFQCCMLCCFLK